MRKADGSAGDANYGEIGQNYSAYRQPEPAIEALILTALGKARTVLNVGAGAGSYEPRDLDVTALEPSASMRAQRPAHLPEAIDGVAESIPFTDQSFDAVMATFTIHQWPDLAAGLAEMRRLSRGPVVILTCNPDQVKDFWLNDYAPGVLAAEARRYPSFDKLAAGLRTPIETIPVGIPLYCRDGFNEAYYGRPEMFLDEKARLSCSAWSFVSADLSAQYIEALSAALSSGAWDDLHGALRTQPTFTGSLYLIISRA